jgi:hypothetical protein
MHKNATKCNKTLSKWCKNKHGASKIIDTFETYHTMNCNDSEKLRYAIHLLYGPAAAWWDNIVAVHPPGRVFT